MNQNPLYSVEIRAEESIVTIRQQCKQISEVLGFGTHDQTRIATAASEIIRNAYEYTGGGQVSFAVNSPLFLIRVTDRGHGIAQLKDILDGVYVSATGLGMGIIGARRLMDHFDIQSTEAGTVVTLGKKLPPGTLLRLPAVLTDLQQHLRQLKEKATYKEVMGSNQELLHTLNELQKRQDDLNRLNEELEETNRGVVVLYTELEEKAQQVQQASDMKSRFISNISHEFRTPLNTIRGLAGMLLERLDGPLTPEQEKQVAFIRRAADDLMELVNDLLDLAKIESGKVTVKTDEIDLGQFFGALRGMMKPLQNNPAVTLVIHAPTDIPLLYTDEGKLSQILRNLLSNALKFTEAGEVRLSATYHETTRLVTMAVADSGIGIAPEDQALVFEEFTQLPNPMQKHVKGTGLGLPLSRRLAELLGGSLTLQSEVGVGSTFTLTVPLIYGKTAINKVLIIDDSEPSRYILKSFMKDYTVVEFGDSIAGMSKIQEEKPDVIFLDLMMPGMTGFEVLAHLRTNPQTTHIPVIIYTNKVLSEADQEYLAAHQVVAILPKEMDDRDVMRGYIVEALEKAVRQ